MNINNYLTRFIRILSMASAFAVFTPSCPCLPIANGLQKEAQASGSKTSTKRIIGTVADSNGPITDAEVILQSFKDEKCARLFMSTDYSNYSSKRFEKLAKQLKACTRELQVARPDQSGHYEFSDLKPGWYAIRLLWNMDQKPSTPVASYMRDGYMVGYSNGKDFNDKYDAMAQGTPFRFPGKDDLTLSFDNGKR